MRVPAPSSATTVAPDATRAPQATKPSTPDFAGFPAGEQVGAGGAVTGGAVTGGAVTGGAVTGGAVTGGAVTGGAVTGGGMTLTAAIGVGGGFGVGVGSTDADVGADVGVGGAIEVTTAADGTVRVRLTISDTEISSSALGANIGPTM